MSNIGGVAYGSSPWTGLQRLQQPSRADLVQSAEALGRGGADAAALRQLQATRTGGAAATQASPVKAPATAASDGTPSGLSEQASTAAPSPTDAAAVESRLNALVQQPTGSTLEFAQRRGAGTAVRRSESAVPADGEGAAGPQRSPQALLQSADGNGDQQLNATEAATPNGALTRVLSPATVTSTAPQPSAAPAPSSPSSPRPVQQGGLDAQAEQLAQWMQLQYATGGGGAMAATGSQVNTSA